MNLAFPIFLANQMLMQPMDWPGHMQKMTLKPSRKQYWQAKVWQAEYLEKKVLLLIFSYTF
jgi:hypothetical protein